MFGEHKNQHRNISNKFLHRIEGKFETAQSVLVIFHPYLSRQGHIRRHSSFGRYVRPLVQETSQSNAKYKHFKYPEDFKLDQHVTLETSGNDLLLSKDLVGIAYETSESTEKVNGDFTEFLKSFLYRELFSYILNNRFVHKMFCDHIYNIRDW